MNPPPVPPIIKNKIVVEGWEFKVQKNVSS